MDAAISLLDKQILRDVPARHLAFSVSYSIVFWKSLNLSLFGMERASVYKTALIFLIYKLLKSKQSVASQLSAS